MASSGINATPESFSTVDDFKGAAALTFKEIWATVLFLRKGPHREPLEFLLLDAKLTLRFSKSTTGPRINQVLHEGDYCLSRSNGVDPRKL